MRKIVIFLVVALLLAVLVAPSAFAAMSKAQEKEIGDLYQQMFAIKKQIIQKYVDAGEITPEQGKWMQERMDQMYKFHSENGFRPGPCMGAGRGPGFGGRGYGPMWRSGNSNPAPTN